MYSDLSKEDLVWECRKLRDKIEKLEKENREQSDELYSLRHRIRDELEPRLQAERNSYDRYVLDPER